MVRERERQLTTKGGGGENKYPRSIQVICKTPPPTDTHKIRITPAHARECVFGHPCAHVHTPWLCMQWVQNVYSQWPCHNAHLYRLTVNVIHTPPVVSYVTSHTTRALTARDSDAHNTYDTEDKPCARAPPTMVSTHWWRWARLEVSSGSTAR